MKFAAFKARCPYEIGDKIRVQNWEDSAQLPGGVHTITEIVCTHYVKAGKVEFLYELDNSGKLVYIIPPEKKGADSIQAKGGG